MSLAHRILQMKNKDDVFALKEISQEVYEKLAMLAFVEEYVNTTPNLEQSKEELIENVEKAFEIEASENKISAEKIVEEPIPVQEKEAQIEANKEKVVYDLIEDNIETEVENNEVPKPETNIALKTEEVIEQPFDELEQLMFAPEENISKQETAKPNTKKQVSLEEELQDTISVDVMADLFENAQPKSLNDKLSTSIQIGLNDRIAFVKNLFDGDQENYNRVVSQLNTFKTEKEATKFINQMVKPDYNWAEHEELENRFLEIVSRKFA